MSKQDEQIRKEFESACVELGYTGYIEPLFDIYKAGRASVVVELPTRTENKASYCAQDGTDLEFVIMNNTRKAIEAAGGRVK